MVKGKNGNLICKFRHLTALLLLIACLPVFAAGYESDKEDIYDMSIEELMDVEVTTVSKKEDTLFKVPAAITVLTSEDIRRSGLQSVPELLRLVPGLHVAKIDSNSWAITSRGFNSLFSEKLLVLIDGRTVYSPLYSGVHWDVQDLMLEDIERIEVIKGPGATLWGANAVNGVISIITKNAADTQGTLLTAGGGTEEKGFSSLRYGGKIGDDAYYRFYGKYFDRDEAVYPNDAHANDGYDAFRQGFRVDWDKSDDEHVTVQGDFYKGHSAKSILLTSPASNYQLDENVDVRGWNILSRWTKIFSDDSDMSLQFYYDRTERYEVELGETRDTFDIDFQHRFQLADNHNLIWGLGYRHTGDNTGGSYTIIFNPSNRNDQLFSGFVQDDITIVADRLKLIVGTKVEKNDYTDYEFQPNARLLWTPNERNTVWASFTRAVSTPSRAYSDMTLIFNSNPKMTVNGSKSLRSQQVQSYELGYRVKPSGKVFIDFALFYNEYDNLFARENDPDVFNTTYFNKLYGETYGGEITAHWQVKDNWKLDAGYSFLRMMIHTDKSSTNTTRAEKVERHSPQNIFHINSQMNLSESLELNSTLYYVDNIMFYQVPSYFRLDTGMTWHVNKDVDFAVVGQNLLDRSHLEFGDGGVIATEVQRGVYAKLTCRF